jgi:hypothetical protein
MVSRHSHQISARALSATIRKARAARRRRRCPENGKESAAGLQQVRIETDDGMAVREIGSKPADVYKKFSGEYMING